MKRLALAVLFAATFRPTVEIGFAHSAEGEKSRESRVKNRGSESDPAAHQPNLAPDPRPSTLDSSPAMHVKPTGIELTFTTDLNTQAAADQENYSIEVWDAAGSAPSAPPTHPKHNPLKVKSVRVSTDEKTVFLEISGLKPGMQMSLKYDLKSADGVPIKGEIGNTIHDLSD